MKRYIVKNTKTEEVIGSYRTKSEAVDAMMDVIKINNDCYDDGNELYLTPFDFVLEVEELKDINESVRSYQEARDYIGGDVFSAKMVAGDGLQVAEETRLFMDLNMRHVKALIALNELFTIAQAWNQADGFVPDYSDRCQDKWSPWFGYKQSAGFVYVFSRNAPTYADASYGSRLCFKTSERAEQFGKQFIGLWNDFLSNK